MLFSSESSALPHRQRQALDEFTDQLRDRATEFPEHDPVLVIHEQSGGTERKMFVSAQALRTWERQCILPLQEAADGNLARIRSVLHDIMPRLHSAIGCQLVSDELGTRMQKDVEALRECFQSNKADPGTQTYTLLCAMLTPPAHEVIALLQSVDELRLALGKEPLGSRIVRQLEDDRTVECLRQQSIIECGEEFLAAQKAHRVAAQEFLDLGRALLATFEGNSHQETLVSQLLCERRSAIAQSLQAEFGKFPLTAAFARRAVAFFSGGESPSLSKIALQAQQEWIKQRFEPLIERMRRHADEMLASLESIQTNVGIATERSVEEADILAGLRESALAMRQKLFEPSAEPLDSGRPLRPAGASEEVAAAIERLVAFYKRRSRPPCE
jgi:hypothetical protein